MNKTYYRHDVLLALREKYPGEINPKLDSLAIVQTNDNIYPEWSLKSEPAKFYRSSMDFIVEDEILALEPMISSSTFPTAATIEENVDRFLNELDLETLNTCFDDIVI